MVKRKILTPMETEFIEAYIQTGNLTRAARWAGYKSPKVQSQKLINNPKIQKACRERMIEMADNKAGYIAKAEEVLSILTSIARNEPQPVENRLKTIQNGEVQEVQKEGEFTPKVEDRLKALELLGKRYALFTDKVQAEIQEQVQFVDDIGDANED